MIEIVFDGGKTSGIQKEKEEATGRWGRGIDKDRKMWIYIVLFLIFHVHISSFVFVYRIVGIRGYDYIFTDYSMKSIHSVYKKNFDRKCFECVKCTIITGNWQLNAHWCKTIVCTVNSPKTMLMFNLNMYWQLLKECKNVGRSMPMTQKTISMHTMCMLHIHCFVTE